jgi:hypothetical protein
MPSEFPGSPKLLKGALVVYATKLPVPNSIVVFQYNPDTMSRSFFEEGSGEDPRLPGGDPTAVLGPPVEMLDVTVELDAADQLETGDRLARDLGIHPALAALELLLYPPSRVLVQVRGLARVGISMITPAELPIVLLVWGRTRVLPVRVTSVNVMEQAFDERLNPIQATVALGMTALTEAQLRRAGPPWDSVGLVTQKAKERAAGLGSEAISVDIRGLLPF